MFMFFFCFFFLQGQSCLSPGKVAASLCKPYVKEDYFQPGGPQFIVAGLLNYNGNLETLRATLTPSECQEALIPFICSNVYKRCYKDKDTGSFPTLLLPSFPFPPRLLDLFLLLLLLLPRN